MQNIITNTNILTRFEFLRQRLRVECAISKSGGLLIEASHLISKVLEKLRRIKSGTLINFSFKVSKTFVPSTPHLKSIPFLTN